MNRKVDQAVHRGLDPLLAPALQLAELPVLPGRREADEIAHGLMAQLERLQMVLHAETDAESLAQLSHVAEAVGVMIISLTAYARGRVPKLASKPNLIVHS